MTITQKQTASTAEEDLIRSVVTSLEDDKGEDIAVIDLRGRSSIADHIVIVTGNSSRQVVAMAEHLAEKLKARHLRVAVEGLGQADWVLLDAGDVVVHLFRPEVRSYYNLERMWAPLQTPAAAL